MATGQRLRPPGHFMGLIAIGSSDFAPAIQRGAQWLLQHQRNGTWDGPHYVGCGFPGYGVGERVRKKKNTAELAQGRELARGFMFNYHL